jgi:hypothetical protein
MATLSDDAFQKLGGDQMRIRTTGAAVAVLMLTGMARGQETPASPRSALDFTHCWGGSKACTHTHSRAGCPEDLGQCARPSESSAFIGYYVGGGNACRGDCRSAQEGTWGWDYQGLVLWRRVALSWNHGRRYQGGTGDYRTDGGPKVPDVPAYLNPALYHRVSEH